MKLPRGWAYCEVTDIAADDHGAITDGPFGSSLKSDHYNSSGVRVIRLGNIGSRRFIGDVEVFVDESRFQELRRHEACAGDLVTAALGEPLGRTAPVPPDYGLAIVKADCFRLRLSLEVDKNLILYWINSPAILKSFLDRSQGIGRVHINLGTFRTTSLPLPPLAEQRRIVAKLDDLTTHIARARAELDRVSTLRATLRSTMLDLAFAGRLTAEFARPTPAQRAAGAWPIDGRTSDRADIPAGWCWASLGDVATVSGGLTKNAQRDSLVKRKYMRVANVYANHLNMDDIAEIGCTEKEYEKARLQSGDILVVEGNRSIEQVGRAALWDEAYGEFVHQNHIIKVRPRSEIVPKFLLWYLLSPGGRRHIQSLASSSSGLHTLSISKVAGIPIPLPTIAEQSAIVDLVEAALARAGRLEAEAARAAALLDRLEAAILARAFHGELVPQDPSEEPAAVLLDRIRAGRALALKARRGRRAAAATGN